MGSTALFRAVLPGELASIRACQSFTNPVGLEWKYFSISLQGARRYADLAAAAFDDGPFAFVQTSIDAGLIADGFRVIVDASIETVVIPTDLLHALGPPTVLEER